MPVLLPIAPADFAETVPHAPAVWAAFVAQRDALVAGMEMHTCNGCDGCGQRCTAGFTVTRDEYQAVQTYLATLPPAEVARVRNQNKVTPWPGAEDTGLTFVHCRYRDRERDNCFVYPARPTVCRLFGHTPWLPCPTGAVQTVPQGAAPVWNEYQRHERHTWEEWDRLLGAEPPAQGADEKKETR